MVDRFHDEYKNGMDSQFSMHFGQLSWTTNPQTANQITELGKRLNEGVKNVELGALSQDVFGAIPKQHFEEARRLAKLTETKLSFHAPLTDPAGLTQNGWQEHQRQQAEEEFKGVIQRAHDLDPDGNVVVNFHASGGGLYSNVPMQRTEQWYKDMKKAKENGDKEKINQLLNDKQYMGIVNTRTGQIQHIPRQEINYLTTNEKVLTPEGRLGSLNESSWDQEKLNLMSLKKTEDEINSAQERWRTSTTEGQELLQLDIKKNNSGLNEKEENRYKQLKEADISYERHKQEISHHAISQLNELYNDYSHSYKPESTYEERNHATMLKTLEETKNKFMESREIEKKYIKKINEYLESNGKDHKAILSENEKRYRDKMLLEARNEIEKKGLNVSLEEINNLVGNLPAPKRWVPVEEHALEKASETFANVAFYGYDKFKNKAPIVSVENVYPEWTLSRGESLKKAIDKSKEKLMKRLIEEKSLSKGEAKEVADKLLGATWDVGHINQLRKYGFKEEEIIEESKKIAKNLKHIHLTDNFGYSDSHLAPGMGNVPIKQQLEAMKKILGNDSFDKMTAVIEAGGIFTQFQGQNPIPYTVDEAGLNSPLYSYDKGPYWKDVRDVYPSYNYGFGNILPDHHFKSQGAGFSLLPKELGGQTGGSDEKGRFANSAPSPN